jgi:hypothetical protein
MSTLARRTVSLDCDPRLAASLADAVAAYAHAAFPAGGSECAQASREALLGVAETCRQHRDGPLRLRKRQMGQIRAAVKWYTTERGEVDGEVGQRLTDLVARRGA